MELTLQQKNNRQVATWLLIGVGMIVIQVLLGGITRLTESGLSITEWKPITGALPPLTNADWQLEFEKYRHTDQFKYVHQYFSLKEFKFIFFWEWLHRFWARMLGVVFAVGFVYFLVRQYFDKKMIKPFVVLFLLGGLQGLIGWIMVASGLNDSHLYVDHIKLALHFVSAMVLSCYTLWFALQLLIPEQKRAANTGFRNYTLAIALVLFVQLTFGAFMAGLKAAMAAPTWPSINGMALPGNLTTGSWISDKMNVHFFHRAIAYLLLFLLVFWYAKAKKISKSFKESVLIQTARWPVIFVLVQVGLGIATVLCAQKAVPGKFGIFEILAELHQLTAM